MITISVIRMINIDQDGDDRFWRIVAEIVTFFFYQGTGSLRPSMPASSHLTNFAPSASCKSSPASIAVGCANRRGGNELFIKCRYLHCVGIAGGFPGAARTAEVNVTMASFFACPAASSTILFFVKIGACRHTIHATHALRHNINRSTPPER